MSAAEAAPGVREFRSATPGDTERIAAAFARAFTPDAGRALRVALRGELGAGKTTFVRGLLREFGVAGAIRSPTYSLVERYSTALVEVLHADLYRLGSAEEFDALAFDDADRGGALWLVEWPDRAGTALPAPDLQLEFQAGPIEHRLRAQAASAPAQAWLQRLPSQAELEVAPPAP